MQRPTHSGVGDSVGGEVGAAVGISVVDVAVVAVDVEVTHGKYTTRARFCTTAVVMLTTAA